MGFADWKKRSKLFRDFEERWAHVSCVEIAQAAYKAGERDGRKQAEAVASNAVELAVLVEREQCATTCDMLAYEWRGANSQVVACAKAIRMRSNVKSEGAARLLAQLPSTDGLGVAVSPAPTFEQGETK